MPYRRLPNTVPAVIRTLKTARDTQKNTPVLTDRVLTAEQWAKLDEAAPTSLLNRVLKEASDVDLAQANQSPLTTQHSQTAAQLTLHVSHFHQVFDLGVVRGKFLAGARSYYGRDVNATTIPDLSTYAAVAEAAENIIKGEAARQAATPVGFVAMALPSAAEVATLRTQFINLGVLGDQAQVNTNKQREELQALYPEAQALAVDICDTVEFFYRKDPDAASRRAKCERWGVVYIFDPRRTRPRPGADGDHCADKLTCPRAAAAAILRRPKLWN